jgi:peroxiredoxin
MRRLLPLIGGLLLGLGLGIIIFFGFLKPDDSSKISEISGGSTPLPVPSLDAPAPAFELTGLSGEQIQLEDYRGQVVLLNFWATWCAPCRLEMPTLQSRADQFSDKLAVVAVNNAEDPAKVQSFVDELSLSFDVLFDPQAEIQQLYRVRGYPTTYLIDAEGIIRVQKIGLLTEGELDDFLQELGVGQ